MRNELIARIETAMAALLSTEQLAALHRVLVSETAGLEIEATIRGEEAEQKDGNDDDDGFTQFRTDVLRDGELECVGG